MVCPLLHDPVLMNFFQRLTHSTGYPGNISWHELFESKSPPHSLLCFCRSDVLSPQNEKRVDTEQCLEPLRTVIEMLCVITSAVTQPLARSLSLSPIFPLTLPFPGYRGNYRTNA